MKAGEKLRLIAGCNFHNFSLKFSENSRIIIYNDLIVEVIQLICLILFMTTL